MGCEILASGRGDAAASGRPQNRGGSACRRGSLAPCCPAPPSSRDRCPCRGPPACGHASGPEADEGNSNSCCGTPCFFVTRPWAVAASFHALAYQFQYL